MTSGILPFWHRGLPLRAGDPANLTAPVQHVSRTDLVDLFEPAPAEEIGTVDEQHGYRQAWLSSPKPEWRPTEQPQSRTTHNLTTRALRNAPERRAMVGPSPRPGSKCPDRPPASPPGVRYAGHVSDRLRCSASPVPEHGPLQFPSGIIACSAWAVPGRPLCLPGRDSGRSYQAWRLLRPCGSAVDVIASYGRRHDAADTRRFAGSSGAEAPRVMTSHCSLPIRCGTEV